MFLEVVTGEVRGVDVVVTADQLEARRHAGLDGGCVVAAVNDAQMCPVRREAPCSAARRWSGSQTSRTPGAGMRCAATIVFAQRTTIRLSPRSRRTSTC